jgi:2-succinyl-5-enolpyruvyl-6-hydroxy-3-cyclohexene-1-carboxylate synthase
VSLGDVSLACASALVDALVAGGVRHACVSPGSRSTPLALALARDGRVRVHVHLDERSSAFFALGIAKATGDPVALACTSGTATAEFFPAIVEASQTRTPLVVLTADRPPRLRGTGANQTIDQVELYGRYARTYLEPVVPASLADTPAWADAGTRAIRAATGDLPGPAQVNCAFEEPLVPDEVARTEEPDLAPAPERRAAERSAPERPAADRAATAIAVRELFTAYAGATGLVVVGGLRHPRTLSLLSLGTVLGWPVMAEPLSGLRLDASDAGRALAAGQFLAADASWRERHRPEVVLQVGAAPTTRATQAVVAAAEELVVLDHGHLDPDPEGRADRRIEADPELFAAIAWDADRPAAADPAWLESWRTADLVARAAIDRLLDAWDEPFEGRVARDVGAFVPNGGVLCVGSSTPVRDLDAYLSPRRPPRIWGEGDLVRIVANRGASGIDGFVSTVLGVAAAGVGPVYALMGDLTFLYDAGGLLWGARREHDAALVVLANGGGEIFSLLPQHDLKEHRELFVTPHGLDLEAVSAAAGAGHERIERARDLSAALERAATAGGVQVVEVPIDPRRDRDRRRQVTEAVGAALEGR